MKTYVINMQKDIKKREEIERQLSPHPVLDYQIWSATEGRNLSMTQLEHFGYLEFSKKYDGFGTLPAFGCALSHYGIYKDIMESDEPYSLILEDDAVISPDLEHCLKSLKSFLDNLSDPAAILLTPDFFFNKNDVVYSDGRLTKLMKVQYGYMTSGYIVNKQGAQLLSKKLFPIKYLADEWADFIKLGLKVYGQIPHLVSYSDTIGEIGSSQLRNKENLLTKLRHVAGRIKGRILWYRMYIRGFRKSNKVW